MTTQNLMSALLLFVTASGHIPATATPKDSARAPIAAQSAAFMQALERGDAVAAAQTFTTDAKVIVSGFDAVIDGRPAIESFWRSGFNAGLKGLSLTTLDLVGEGSLRIETGNYAVLGAGGSDLGRGRYLLVWKKEGAVWRIHRDIGTASASPVADRVGFPAAYSSALKLLDVASREKEPAIMTTFANDLAEPIARGAHPPYPYGSVIVMEFANSVRDGEGQPLRDAKGALVKGDIARIDVMRRERGFGAGYGEQRAGEWEFASYRPDGSLLMAPANSANCAACHRNAGAEKDFVFHSRP